MIARRTRFELKPWFWPIVVLVISAEVRGAPRRDGQLELQVVDSKTGQEVACRMHLFDQRKRAVKLGLPRIAEFGGHFYVDGQIALPLRKGQFTFEVDAGPEYRILYGHFEIQRHAQDSKRLEVRRVADLAAEGWFGGDLDFDRNERDLPLILRAEGLQDIQTPQFAQLVTDEQSLPSTSRELVIARTPYAWCLPYWLAEDALAAVQLIHHHSLRDDVVDDEQDGRPRDRSLYPGSTGNGRWSEAVYHHMLNCGYRIPPVAGSGSGMNQSPVGTNRVYAYCGESFSVTDWWEALESGQVFVTNGPLLRASVEGHAPGYVFHMREGERLELQIGLELATRVPVEYLQIIKNGRIDAEIRLADLAGSTGRLPPVVFEKSGWFLVRAVTNNHRVYQFASTGPYYVEMQRKPLVSRTSVKFFLDWLAEFRESIVQQELDVAKQEAMLSRHEAAETFFRDLLAEANAD